jgi:hypothetical protein
MLILKLEQNYQTQLIESSYGPGLRGHLTYESYLTIVMGFRGPLQNHMILGISCSCTESIDVFS